MAKRCRNCANADVTSQTETYLYKESGLPNVVLVGVVVRRCPACGHNEVVIPRIEELHRTIALALIRKPAQLSGAEVRYLRKHLGWSGEDFAAHMGVDPSTVSKWENNKAPIGTSSDRLLRLLVVHGYKVQDYDLDELKTIVDEQQPPVMVRLQPRAKGWELSAA